MAFVRSLPIALRISVFVVAVAAAAYLSVDGHEVPIIAAEGDDPLWRNVVVLAEEPQFHEVHHIRVGQHDGPPFLPMLLLVVAERPPIGWTGDDCHRDVIHLRADTEAHRD